MAVGARLLAALLIAALAAGCCQDASAVPAGPAAVRVTITRDYGATVLRARRAAPGQPAMTAVRRIGHVSTSYGGRFVESIDGLSGGRLVAGFPALLSLPHHTDVFGCHRRSTP